MTKQVPFRWPPGNDKRTNGATLHYLFFFLLPLISLRITAQCDSTSTSARHWCRFLSPIAVQNFESPSTSKHLSSFPRIYSSSHRENVLPDPLHHVPDDLPLVLHRPWRTSLSAKGPKLYRALRWNIQILNLMDPFLGSPPANRLSDGYHHCATRMSLTFPASFLLILNIDPHRARSYQWWGKGEQWKCHKDPARRYPSSCHLTLLISTPSQTPSERAPVTAKANPLPLHRLHLPRVYVSVIFTH